MGTIDSVVARIVLTVHIDAGGRQIAVAKRVSHVAQIDAGVGQARARGMPQPV